MSSVELTSWKKSYPIGVIFLLIALIWAGAALRLRPDVWFSDHFLCYDEGFNLLIAKEILAGKLLYRDIFYQYGPLPAYLYASFAAVFGNTPQAYTSFVLVCSLANIVLIYLLLSQILAGWRLFLFVLFAIFPVFLMPGPITHGYSSAAYASVERTLLLLLLLLWQPTGDRGDLRAGLLGLTMGAMQWVKFGNAFVVGFAIVVVDLCFLIRSRFVRQDLSRWLGTSLAMLAGFMALEGLLVGLSVALLPWPIAKDELWPSYMLQNYEGSVTSENRFPHWIGAEFFLTRQLGLIISLVFFLLTIWRYAKIKKSILPDF